MAYTDKEEGLLAHDALMRAVCQIEVLTDDGRDELLRRVLWAGYSPELRDVINAMIQMIHDEGIDGDRA